MSNYASVYSIQQLKSFELVEAKRFSRTFLASSIALASRQICVCGSESLWDALQHFIHQRKGKLLDQTETRHNRKEIHIGASDQTEKRHNQKEIHIGASDQTETRYNRKELHIGARY